MKLPEDYIVEKFYQFVGKPSKNRYNNTYQGSCPMCREGNSWLKKKRFYFFQVLYFVCEKQQRISFVTILKLFKLIFVH